MQIKHISCFCTDDPQSGNRAAVIENFVNDDADKQKLAAELNLPVTVFIERQATTPLLRFFYPLREMPLCIHGALAAAYFLCNKTTGDTIHAITKDQQSLTILKKPNDVFQLAVAKGTILPETISTTTVDQMLGINFQVARDHQLPFCVATIGSPKLLIPLTSFASLAELRPDFNFIKQWSLENNINGLYVYTADVRDQNTDYVARGFNPKGGNNEDAATGVAAGALYTALSLPSQQEICVAQGEFMQQPSRLVIASTADKILVGGKVRLN